MLPKIFCLIAQLLRFMMLILSNIVGVDVVCDFSSTSEWECSHVLLFIGNMCSGL